MNEYYKKYITKHKIDNPQFKVKQLAVDEFLCDKVEFVTTKPGAIIARIDKFQVMEYISTITTSSAEALLLLDYFHQTSQQTISENLIIRADKIISDQAISDHLTDVDQAIILHAAGYIQNNAPGSENAKNPKGIIDFAEVIFQSMTAGEGASAQA